MAVKIKKLCPVDTDGIFKFENYVFQISAEDERYKVNNKAIYVNNIIKNDYTNESEMDSILVELEENQEIAFYDEEKIQIDSSLISFVNKEG